MRRSLAFGITTVVTLATAFACSGGDDGVDDAGRIAVAAPIGAEDGQ